MPTDLPEPWLSFLREVDSGLSGRTDLYCLGGFVVTVVYGSERETSDVDILTLVRGSANLRDKAGEGSKLHRRHGLYIDPVGIATLPEDYEDRLSEVFPGNCGSR